MVRRLAAVAMVLSPVLVSLLFPWGIAYAHAPARGRAAGLMPSIADALTAPEKACQGAIAVAEIAHGIPVGFLLAIGRVESGRPDPRTGLVQPWPWTIDVAGKGAFFATRTEAAAAVQAAQQGGTASIDVGCMQINLQQHPAAFATLDEAFDPKANADYAARFLVDLRRESGDWLTASGLYHSRTATLATPYREMVAARLNGTSLGALSLLAMAPPRPPVPPRRPLAVLANAWAATLEHDDPAATPTGLWPRQALWPKRALWPNQATPALQAAPIASKYAFKLSSR